MGRKRTLTDSQRKAKAKLASELKTLNEKKSKEDAARPINTIRVKSKGRGGSQKSYQRWDGKQWLTGTGKDAAKYKGLYNNQQELNKQQSTNQAPSNRTPKQPPAPPVPKRVPKAGKPEEFGPYRYPQDAIEEGQDFIRFKVFNYKKNRSLVTRDQNNLKEKTLGTIILPIPSQINDASSVGYGAGGLNFMQEQGLGAVQNIIGSGNIENFFKNTGSGVADALNTASQNKGLISQFIAKEAINSLGGNITMDQLTARNSGEIINPNMELLFSGPKLRKFKFSFKFTPRFKRESDEVRNIIKAFKRNMKPKGSGGNFLTTPNIFEIRYMEGTKDHKFLNKFKICALTDVSVNYTADGVYATYHDGTPISMTMDLSFSELTPIYNEDYDEYGNDTGVGF